MAGSSAGSIYVDLLLNSSKFESGIKRSRQATNAWEKDVKKIGQTLRAFGGVLAATFSTVAIVSSLNSVVHSMDDIGKASDRLAISTESLSKMAFAGGLAGVSLEDLEKSVKKMQQTIVFASDGLATYTRVFDTLGLKVEDVINLKPEDAFNKLLTALLKIENPTIRNARAVDLFGRAGLKLINFAGDGAKSLEELYKEAERLGVVFDREAAAKAERFNDSILRLNKSFQGLLVSFVERGGLDGLSSALEGLANNMGTIADAAQVVAVIFATKYTISLTAAAISTLKASQQAIAYQIALARMAGVSATTAVSVTALSRALALIGGPIGAAIIAVGAAIYYLGTQTDDATDIQNSFNKSIEEAKRLNDSINPAYAELASNIKLQRDAQLEAAQAAIAHTKALIEQNKTVNISNALSVARTGVAAPVNLANQSNIDKLNKQLQEQLDKLNKLKKEIEKKDSVVIGTEIFGPPKPPELDPANIEAAKKRTESLKSITDELNKQTAAIELQNDHFGESQVAIDRLVQQQEILEKLKESGVKPTEKELDLINQKLNALYSEKQLNQELQEAEAERARQAEELAKQQEEQQRLLNESVQKVREGLVDGLIDAAKGAGSLADKMKSVAAEIAEAVVKAQLLKLITDATGGGGGGAGGGGFLGPLLSFLPSFDVGTDYVPYDMVAKVHKGERILTAEENKAYESGSGVTMNVYTPNADSFRASDRQITRRVKSRLAMR